MTFEEVKKEVLRLDPKLKEDSSEFKIATVLLSSLVVGNSISKLRAFTGYKTLYLQHVGDRLRANGIWVGRKIACNWFGKDGGISFWCDVAVGAGFLRRSE